MKAELVGNSTVRLIPETDKEFDAFRIFLWCRVFNQGHLSSAMTGVQHLDVTFQTPEWWAEFIRDENEMQGWSPDPDGEVRIPARVESDCQAKMQELEGYAHVIKEVVDGLFLARNELVAIADREGWCYGTPLDDIEIAVRWAKTLPAWLLPDGPPPSIGCWFGA